MSRSPVISLRWISPWLCTLILVATPARSERPRSEQEEMERATRPAPAFALPDHWTPGQPVRFPRQLLPYLMRDMGALEGIIPDPADEPAAVLRALATAPERREPAFGGNRMVNDPSHDPPDATQSENTLAAFGRFMVAGWNDSFDPRTPRNFSGFGYSTDGGQTWHDGGILPDATTTDRLFGDPSLTVDQLGNFYYASLYARPDITLGVAVNRGRFENDVLTFEPPVLAAKPGAHDSFDKEWMTTDPKDGTLYMSYTRFFDRCLFSLCARDSSQLLQVGDNCTDLRFAQVRKRRHVGAPLVQPLQQRGLRLIGEHCRVRPAHVHTEIFHSFQYDLRRHSSRRIDD